MLAKQLKPFLYYDIITNISRLINNNFCYAQHLQNHNNIAILRYMWYYKRRIVFALKLYHFKFLLLFVACIRTEQDNTKSGTGFTWLFVNPFISF